MRVGKQDKEHILTQRRLSLLTKEGDLIRFKEERKPYRVIARDDNFLICTKPFNLQKTFLYCIVNLKEGVRGPDDHWTKFNYSDFLDAKQALIELNTGKLEVSYRRRAVLNIGTYKIKNTDWKLQKCPFNSPENLKRLNEKIIKS